MKITDVYFDNVLEILNNVFDFKLEEEKDFKSFKAYATKGYIKHFYDEKIGTLGMIKTTALLRQVRTYSFVITPLFVDGPTLIYEYNKRGNFHNAQIRIFNTFINKNVDCKNIRNKAAITKRRYIKLSDQKLNNDEWLFDWSIGKKAYKKDAIELIKISRIYLAAYIELLRSCEKCDKKAKNKIVKEFCDAKIKNNGYLFNTLRKIFGNEEADYQLKMVLGIYE